MNLPFDKVEFSTRVVPTLAFVQVYARAIIGGATYFGVAQYTPGKENSVMEMAKAMGEAVTDAAKAVLLSKAELL